MRTNLRWVAAGAILVVDAAIVIADTGGGARSVPLTRFDVTFAVDAAHPPAPSAPPRSADVPRPLAPSPLAVAPRASAGVTCAPRLRYEAGRGCVPDDVAASPPRSSEAAPLHGPALAVSPTHPAPPAHPSVSVVSPEDREVEERYAASDVGGAIALARTQCGRGDPFGCALAGSIELREHDAHAPEDAEALLEKACAMGDTWGCTRVIETKARR